MYWIPVFEVLDRAGLEVHLVNPRATKQVSGRKSDVLDCQWIQQLMSYGLPSGRILAYAGTGVLSLVMEFPRNRGLDCSHIALRHDWALTFLPLQSALRSKLRAAGYATCTVLEAVFPQCSYTGCSALFGSRARLAR